MVTTITGTTNKPASSEELKDFFSNQPGINGTLYIGYPIIATADGAYPIDAILISPEKGVVIFNLIEGHNSDGYEEEQDDSFNKVESRLKGHKELVSRRELMVSINVITYVPAITNINNDDEYPICNTQGLKQCLDNIAWSHPEYYEKAVSVLQSVSMMRKGRKKRDIIKFESRGAKLQKLEDSIATLDNAQGKAVIETAEGVQRIRGLAGSGKTIVLALKAAYLHAQHPNWKMAITFNTRSLKGQFKSLINTFYIEQTGAEPDWENLQIIHAWGSSIDSTGIYYNFCMKNGVECLDYRNAKNRFGRINAFGGVCEKALSDAKSIEQMYDVILVDEAQDFPVSFLRMCYSMLVEPKRLVYAYDELQNLTLQSLPAPEELFGKKEDGSPVVQFLYDSDGTSKQDIILKKCYRNSRPALVTAHALGFGIYRKPGLTSGTGLVQIFEQKSLWKDIGYVVEDGELEDGERVLLARTEESSPKFLEEHSSIDDLVLFKSFESKKEQDLWVRDQIIKNLKEDELRPDDIIVININPLTTKSAVAPIRQYLYENDIMSHVAGVDSSPDVFFSLNNSSVAFTGVYRAKGNEAAMVYVVNADDCVLNEFDGALNSEIAKVRNRLFTAITRSKAWVRVVGVGTPMKELEAEYQKVKDCNYKLDFIYPTEEERKRLNIVNRDISQAEKKSIADRRNEIKDLVNDLKSGKIYLEDLGDDTVNQLRQLLRSAE